MSTALKIAEQPQDEELAQDFMEHYEEALLITIDKANNNIGLHYKFKSQDGVLNDYLAGLLAQLLKMAKNESTKNSVYQATTDQATRSGQ